MNIRTKGVYKSGTLNTRWDCFKDPFFADAQYMMGYKGTSFLESGYVYAPLDKISGSQEQFCDENLVNCWETYGQCIAA